MKFYVYPDKQGQFRWYLQAENSRIIADSGEGYQNKSDCLAAIELVKKSADVEVLEKALGPQDPEKARLTDEPRETLH
jgi:uncharacterized protein